jgi:hypothetical protein
MLLGAPNKKNNINQDLRLLPYRVGFSKAYSITTMARCGIYGTNWGKEPVLKSTNITVQHGVEMLLRARVLTQTYLEQTL